MFNKRFNTFYYLCVVLTSLYVTSSHESVFNFVIDVLSYNKRFSPPYQVIAFLCWPQSTAMKFVKKLSDENVMAIVLASTDESSLLSYTSNKEFQMFVLDISCENSEHLLTQANDIKLLYPPNRWFLLQRENNISGQHANFDISFKRVNYINENTIMAPFLIPEDWRILLNSLNIHVNTAVMIGMSVSNGKFILVDVYKRNTTLDADYNIVAHWSESFGLLWRADFIVARRRQNLQGVPMRVATVVTDNSTLEHMTDLVNIHIDSLSRVTNFFVTHAIEQMNCSMKIFYVTSWGYLVNGTWDGIVGHLIRDEADIAGTALLLVPERNEVVQYLMMTVPTKIAFVFRQPPLSFTSNVFTLPFSKGVWVSTVAVLALCGFLLYYAFKWESIHHDNLNDSEVDNNLRNMDAGYQITWSDVVMFVMGAVTEQGSPVEPNKLTGRIISIFLFIFVIFMITSYSASIVVLLQSTTNSIQTLKDLLESGLELASHDTVYNRYFMQRMNDTVRKTMYQKKIAPEGLPEKFYPLHKGVEMLRTGRFAFHFELGTGFKLISETFLEHEKCGLKTINFLPVIDTYQVVQKNSPYKEIISIAFHKMIERGIVRRAYHRYYTKKPECITEGSNFVEVGLTEFHPVLLILSCGILCSLLILLIECWCIRR